MSVCLAHIREYPPPSPGALVFRGQYYLLKNYFIENTTHNYAARHREELCHSPDKWVQVVLMVNSLYQEVEILVVVFHNNGATVYEHTN